MGRFIQLESYNGEPVITEPGLRDCEQETACYFSARTAKEGYVQVSSNQAPIVRALLKHKEYKKEELTAISTPQGPKIIYTAGRLPMNCLRITASKGSMSIGKIITKSAKRATAEDPAESSDEAPAEASVEALQEVGMSGVRGSTDCSSRRSDREQRALDGRRRWYMCIYRPEACDLVPSGCHSLRLLSR